MGEITLELKFLKFEHFGDHAVNIKDVDRYEYNEHNRKDDVECLPKDWYNICLSHDLRESRVFVIDYL